MRHGLRHGQGHVSQGRPSGTLLLCKRIFPIGNEFKVLMINPHADEISRQPGMYLFGGYAEIPVFKCLCENGRQGVRRTAQQTGLSKSSVHRLTQAMARRDVHPESWLWETADGRQWLTRLVVATLYTFGLKRGVGMDTMSEFFARLRLERQVGCSPSALRGVMHALEAALLETAGTWEKDACAKEEGREIIGAVDETFLEQMMLVLMDLRTGYLLLEEVAEDRTYATWKARVEARLTALGIGVRYLISDRAKALIQLAEQGLACLSMPDFFHCMHDLVKGSALSLARHVRHAHQELTKAEEGLRKHTELDGRSQGDAEAQHHVDVTRAAVQRWEEVQRTYRHHLETLSLTLHPFHLHDSSPQTSAQVHSRLHAAVAAVETLAQAHQVHVRHDMLKKVRHQLPALAALVDFWWAGVDQDLEQAAISAPWRQWARESLLPGVYWEHQVAHTRGARRKAKLQRAWAEVRATFDQHGLTQRLAPWGVATIDLQTSECGHHTLFLSQYPPHGGENRHDDRTGRIYARLSMGQAHPR